MITQTIYADRSDAKDVAKKLQYQWIVEILNSMGVDWGDSFFEDDPDDRTILQRAQSRKILGINKINVLDDQFGEAKIYVDNELIAQWERPSFKLHKDYKELDPRKKYYMSIEISYWSVFDEDDDEEEEE